MRKNVFIILGVLVALTPFISIPYSYKTPLLVLFGGLIAFFGYQEKYLKKKISVVGVKRPKKAPVPSDTIIVSTPSDNEHAINKEG